MNYILRRVRKKSYQQKLNRNAFNDHSIFEGGDKYVKVGRIELMNGKEGEATKLAVSANKLAELDSKVKQWFW